MSLFGIFSLLFIICYLLIPSAPHNPLPIYIRREHAWRFNETEKKVKNFENSATGAKKP